MGNDETLLQNRDFLYKIATFSYSEPLRNIMEKNVYVCRPGDSIKNVAHEMAERKISSVVVTDGELKPLGIVTERDIVRNVVAAEKADSSEVKVSDIMTPDPVCLSPDDSLFDALSALSRYSIKHLPLVEMQRVAGIVTLRQIMKMRYAEPMVLIGQLQQARKVSDFKLIKEELIPLVQEKLDTNTDPVDIVTMISLINRSIHKRLLASIINESGQAPPAEFCFFVTGSHGRRENLLFPDQDFCVIIDDYEDRNHDAFDQYFHDISKRLSEALHETGFAYCSGNVMGQNPMWRKRVSEWKAHIFQIFEKPGPYTVRYLTLIFDSAPLLGETALFNAYNDYAFNELLTNRNVLRQMHDEEEGRHKVPLGIFSSFITEKDDAHRGEIDMKRSGLIFVIESMRVLSMKYGIRETSTLKRLQTLVAKEVINREDSEYFENAYRVILYHTLQAQVNNFVRHSTHDYHLNPRELSSINQKMLKEAFKAISQLQEIVRGEFGELVL